jgi:triosephosphate isomerase
MQTEKQNERREAMKHIYLNAKRFDIPPSRGGVNRIAPMRSWAETIIRGIEATLRAYDPEAADFTLFLPEAHLLQACAALGPSGPIAIGCQGVHRADTAAGGNFGAFTTCRTASAVREMGCAAAIIGHCEERADKAGILAEAGVKDPAAINRILNAEIKAAQAADLSVLYCVGETAEEHGDWRNVLGAQLEIGLYGADMGKIVIAYEPVWSIGPGKTPAGRDYIAEAAAYIKERTGEADVVYGGGLKAENAAMLAGVAEIDGGLIALTRFTGEIGFYPDEFLEIVKIYLGGES